MRCPKCGYISFDHMETCLKCKKDISGNSEVEGTTYHAAAPSFLQMVATQAPVDENESSSEIEFNGAEDSYDFSDPDLDVLVDESEEFAFEENDGGEVVAMDDVDLEGGGGEFQLDSDESSDEDGSFDIELDADEEQSTPSSLSLPDELSDISDLAPPVQEQENSGESMSLSLDDDVSLDENLDLDGLDLDLGLGEESNDNAGDVSLSLDDIDFSVEEDSAVDGISMDLDLGGLDENPASEKKKLPGSLDDLSLSLD